jgi:tetratricopeptide (TPR) repeat protein
MPGGSGESTWSRRLHEWAERSLADVHAALAASRQKAILRLLHLLETDPDRGLRFSPPLSGKRAHRGLAPPTDRLAERDVDFDLNRLGGGPPADPWCISAEYHYRLMTCYRELANREIRLGRYRRAAYIFAELLGDLDAAASALSQGRHWREAAVLYRERLHRPQEAARCLEQGGLWTEAISLYEELGQYEKAGDLLLKLEQPDQAHVMFNKAVTKHRRERDLLSAARILDEKLHEPDRALEELEKGWPVEPQAGGCLRGILSLLGRLGRHQAARDRIDTLRNSPVPEHVESELVDIMAEMATGYPDRQVQHSVADCTRAIASRLLPSAPSHVAIRILAAVRRLEPGDRLLGRDCDRYLERRAHVTKRPAPKSRQRSKRLSEVRTIKLARGPVWKHAVRSGRAIYAAATVSDKLLLARCNWDGVLNGALSLSHAKRSLHESRILLAADPLRDDRLLVHVFGSAIPFENQAFPTTDQFPQEVRVQGMAPGTVAASRTAHGITWLLVSQGDHFTLMAQGTNGELIATYTVPYPERWHAQEEDLLSVPIPLHARGDTVYVGLDDTMLVYHRFGDPEIVKFDRPIVSLAGSWPNTRTRIAVGLAQGGALYWEDFEGSHREPFSSEITRPVVGLNRGGYLIAASTGRFEVYSTRDRRLELIAESRVFPYEPIAVLPGPRTDQFAIACSVPRILVYELC